VKKNNRNTQPTKPPNTVWHTFAFVFVDIFAAGEAVPEGAPPARPGGRAGYHQPLRGAFVRVDAAALPVTFPR
jgi:hypothetical protein